MTRPEHPAPGREDDDGTPPAGSDATADDSGDVDPRDPTEDASSPDLTTGDGSESPEPLEPPD